MGEVLPLPLRIPLAIGTMGTSEAGGAIPALVAVQKAIMPSSKLTPPGSPAAPATDTAAVQLAAAEAAARRNQARGVRSTILSSLLQGGSNPGMKTTMGS